MQNSFYSTTSYLILLLFLSCNPIGLKVISTQEINTWATEEGVIFEDIQIDSNDQLVIILEYSNDYDFENIYLKMIVSSDDQAIIEEDVFSIQLLDENGKWMGKTSGNYIKILHPIDINNRLELDSPVHLEFFQYSRSKVLKHIKSLGIGRNSR